jgi:hypothetical protein
MTVGRNVVLVRASAVMMAVVLSIAVLGLTGCGPALDPDNGASISSLTKQYAPPSVKDQVVASLVDLGYTPNSVGDTYVTYPDPNDTSTVTVDGTFFGPGPQKGVLSSYSVIEVKRSAEGSWTITKTTVGVAKRPAATESSTATTGTGK